MNPNRSRRDVVVVGGRVAGSATAMLLARLGHDVVVVDQASFPSDTTSTHSIARSGVVQLQRWGLLDAVLDSGAPAITQVTFHALGESVSRTIKHKAGVGLVVSPRRYVLDAILATAAGQAGADVRYGVTVTGVRRDRRGRVAGVYGHDRGGARVDIGARYVIGADGLRSRVAHSAGAAINEARAAGGATQYAYYAGIRWTGIELFVAERSFAGVFPTHHPQLAERLRRARRTSPVRGMLRMPNQVRQAFGPGWALVGDAGYHRDAVTAHGIKALATASLDQAPGLRTRLARAAVLSGDLASAEEALAGLEPSGGPDDGAILLAQGMLAYFSGDIDGADAAVEAARGMALAPGAPNRLLDVITLQGMIAHNRGEWFDRLRRELRATTENPELASAVFDSHLCVAEYLLYGPTPYDEVVALTRQLREQAERTGARRGVAFAVTVAGEAALLAGDLDAARADLAEALALHTEMGADTGAAHALQQLAEVALAAGDRAAAERSLRRAGIWPVPRRSEAVRR